MVKKSPCRKCLFPRDFATAASLTRRFSPSLAFHRSRYCHNNAPRIRSGASPASKFFSRIRRALDTWPRMMAPDRSNTDAPGSAPWTAGQPGHQPFLLLTRRAPTSPIPAGPRTTLRPPVLSVTPRLRRPAESPTARPPDEPNPIVDCHTRAHNSPPPPVSSRPGPISAGHPVSPRRRSWLLNRTVRQNTGSGLPLLWREACPPISAEPLGGLKRKELPGLGPDISWAFVSSPYRTSQEKSSRRGSVRRLLVTSLGTRGAHGCESSRWLDRAGRSSSPRRGSPMRRNNLFFCRKDRTEFSRFDHRTLTPPHPNSLPRGGEGAICRLRKKGMGRETRKRSLDLSQPRKLRPTFPRPLALPVPRPGLAEPG